MNNIEILKDLEKYISFANKQCNFSNDADYKWHKELAGMIENLIQENKELKEENEKLTYARNWYFEHFTSQACTPEQLHKILRFDYIPKSKIKEIIYPTPENPISFEVQSSEMYKKLEKLVEGE